MWNFQGLIKNEEEIRRVTKKKQCGISRRLELWPWNFREILNNFVEFPRVELFAWNFQQ